jgi:DnaJ-class molecular chaperone
MRGEGMPSRFGKGDQLVHVTVTVPKKINKKQRELIEELGKEFEGQSNRKGWFKR